MLEEGDISKVIGPAAERNPQAALPGCILPPIDEHDLVMNLDDVSPLITLARTTTPFGEITIFRNRETGAVAYCHGDHYQSEADPAGISLAAYVHALHALVVQTQAHEVLMIGCAGGTLATMLAATGQAVTVVDIDPEAIRLARQYFALPPGVECHASEGQVFLERSPHQFDAIVVDAFAGDSVPANLRSPVFFRLARERLVPGGCLFFNMFVAHDLDADADRVAALMAEAGFTVRLLDSPGRTERNVIVMGGAVTGLTSPGILLRPAISADDIVTELAQMRFRSARRRAARADEPASKG